MESLSLDSVVFRSGEESDLPLIFSSWLKSFRISGLAKGIPNPVYFDEHHKLIQSILRHSKILCAVNREDPSQVYGWLCAEQGAVPIVHYIYVKQIYRRMGIGRSLIQAIPEGAFIYTHETGLMDKLRDRGVYSPYHAFKRSIE